MRKRLDELGMDIIHEIALRENEFRELIKIRPDKLADEFSNETLQFHEVEEQLNRLRKIYSESVERRFIYAIISY